MNPLGNTRARHVVTMLVVLVIGFVAGRLGGGNRGHAPSEPAGATAASTWTCAMHPQIQLPQAGQCPICFMDLIPLPTDMIAGDAPRLRMSEAAASLAEIRTIAVTRGNPRVEVRLVGKVAPDETRTVALTARVAGRLDRLHADFMGIAVRAGEPLAEIYSPELITGARELRQGTLASAAREKLRLLGLDNAQIDELATSDTPPDHIVLRAGRSGVVVQKNAVEGDYVKPGSVIYRVADLSAVWVLLDVHESDLTWVRVGQDVEFAAEARPGQPFRGKVSFVPPTLDPRTRTAKVRLDVENTDGLLMPEMFVRATLFAEPVADGKSPLVVPRSAVLLTGKRAIVYVRDPDAESPTFEGRQITLGPRAGDVYIVRDGLTEGERVVVNGAFKIDSALQIQAKPSLMSIPSESASKSEPRLRTNPRFQSSLDPLYTQYLALATALSNDDPGGARQAYRDLHAPLHGVAADGLSERDRLDWAHLSEALERSLSTSPAETIDATRVGFESVSNAMIAILDRFGHTGDVPLFRVHCPMAFDYSGADWLQDHDTVENPYFGAQMHRCGSVMATFEPAGEGS